MAATDPFGNPIPPRPRNPIFPAFPIAVISIVIAAMLYIAVANPFSFHARSLLRSPILFPGLQHDCAALGISTPEGREGSCLRRDESGVLVEYRVVDHRHTLRMPSYSVRIAGGEIVPTRVPLPRDESLYPNGEGVLISKRLLVTNRTAAPLPLLGAPAPRHPQYPAHAVVELTTPESGSGGEEVGFPAILDARGGPPTLGTIPPGATAAGWVSFVCSLQTERLESVRPADLDFYGSEHGRPVVGQIRLWK